LTEPAHAEWFYDFRLAIKTDIGSQIVRASGIVLAAVNEREVAESLLGAGPGSAPGLDRHPRPQWIGSSSRIRRPGLAFMLGPADGGADGPTQLQLDQASACVALASTIHASPRWLVRVIVLVRTPGHARPIPDWAAVSVVCAP
jgi:hypothetical protein